MELSTNHDEVVEKEQTDAVHTFIWEKPNLKGDWLNLFLLTLLYMMQGLPYSLTLSLSMILQSKKMVTYDEQVSTKFPLYFVLYEIYYIIFQNDFKTIIVKN